MFERLRARYGGEREITDIQEYYNSQVRETAMANIVSNLNSIAEARDDSRTPILEGEIIPNGHMAVAQGMSDVSIKKMFLATTGRKRSTAIMDLYRTKFGGSQYSGKKIIRPEYDYSRIDTFFKTESYFSRSCQRQIETLLRSGYSITSITNPALAAKVQGAFTRMQMRTSVSLDQYISTMANHLLNYGVFFLQKVRRGTRLSFIRTEKDNDNDIINNLRIMNIRNMAVYVDEYGNIASAKEQMTQYTPKALYESGFKKIAGTEGIPAKDLVYCVIADPGDKIFPDPPPFQSLADILTLRSLEETGELLAAQCGSPLLHATVDDSETSYTDAEVQQIHNTIVGMAPNGFITTRGKVKLEVKNLQSAVADLTPLIDYFKKRVLVGMASSPISVGEADTGNRSTVDSLDTGLADRAMYIGASIAAAFTYNIIPDMLLAMGESEEELIDKKTGKPTVVFAFNDMQFDRYQAKINTAVNLFNANGVSHDEFRVMIGNPPMGDDEKKDLSYNLFPAKAAAAAEGTGESTTSQTQPSNQYGTKSAPGSKTD